MARKALAAAALVLVLALGLTLFLFAASPTSAQSPQPKPKKVAAEEIPAEKRLFDADGDKLYDNLDHKMVKSADTKDLKVVVLFNQPLDQVDLKKLRKLLGGDSDLPERFKFPSVDGIATTLNKGQIKKLAREGIVQQIENDDVAQHDLGTATYWFGVQRARLDFPQFTGAGRTIAILDTGIDASHQDLSGKVVAWADFTDTLAANSACLNPCDPHGHGTHVASIAAGTGATSDGEFRGVAPGADLAGIRVLDGTGAGSRATINLGLEWVLEFHATHNIQVLNLSLGFGGCSSGQSSTERLINELVASGVVVTLSAGNSGPGRCTVGDPAAAAHGITVAAMSNLEHGAGLNFGCGSVPEGGFFLACFSGRGPTFDGRIKPDISGPGVQINAAKATTANDYVAFSGTSMASPFVAGVAALLRQANVAAPGGTCTLVSGSQNCSITNPVKDMLLGTAQCWGGLSCPNIDYGAERLDAYAALLSAQGITADNVRTPEHPAVIPGSLAGTGAANNHVFNVKTLFFPIAVALIMDDDPICTGQFDCSPDFDLRLSDPAGNQVALSWSLQRQETVSFVPTVRGDYTLTVNSYRGAGGYTVDISAGTAPLPPPGIAVTSDGQMGFGLVSLGVTADTIGDPEVVQMSLGPGDLNIRTTPFSDGVNTWALGAAIGDNGPDRVVWEFSPDEAAWTVFDEAGVVFDLAQGLKDGQTQKIFFRLTMPTDIISGSGYAASIIITGTPPD